MYTITCCRTGPFGKPNMKCKGQFKLTFKTLSEFAKYISQYNHSIYFPFIHEELTKKEYKILSDKIVSLNKKMRM